jgi:uncharacterized membrane protein HdeD (DUF308 family)
MNRNWRWWTVALRGIAAIAFGVLTLLAPIEAVLLFGAFALVDGLLALALPARGSVQPRGTVVLRALVSIGAGLYALLAPEVSLVSLIAGWAIAAGVVELVMAVEQHRRIRHEWLLAQEGLFSLGFGIAVMVAQMRGNIVVGLWIGAYALVLGGVMLATAVRLRAHRIGTPVVAPA